MAYLIIDPSGNPLSRPNDGDVVSNPDTGQVLTVSFLRITTPDGDYEVDFLPGIVDLYQGSNDRSSYSTNIQDISVEKGTRLHKIGSIDHIDDVTLTHLGDKYRVQAAKLDDTKPDSLILCEDGFIRTLQDSFSATDRPQGVFPVLHKVDE